MRISIDEIRNRSEEIFKKAGVAEADAKIITQVLLETEMRGVFTHGFFRVPKYVNCIKTEGINAESELHLAADTPSWALADGNKGLGIVLSYKAMQLAIQKAKETGVGIVNVRNSHHFGAAGYYTSMCADQKMIGMAMSNGDAMIAATGSRTRSIGNNPFSFAAPAGKYDKVVYDIAMSGSSDIKILKMAKEGKMLPPGWIIDKEGKETLDPSEYVKGGTLLPFGGYKGYGMAMMVEILGAALSGAGMTTDVHAWNTNPEKGGNVGHFFMALDVEKVMQEPEFEARMEEMIGRIKGCEKAVGVSEIFYPGEIELRKLGKCLEEGFVDVADDTMERFAEVEKSLGL